MCFVNYFSDDDKEGKQSEGSDDKENEVAK